MELGGWYLLAGHGRKYIPVFKKPKNIDVLMILELISSKNEGVIILENIDVEDGVKPENLTLYFENGNYLLMLLDFDEEGFIDVRTPYNSKAEKGEFQNILGEPYGATTIVQDIELIKRCFIEFNTIGNVSRELMT